MKTMRPCRLNGPEHPDLMFDMRFRNKGVNVKFELAFLGDLTDISIQDITFDEEHQKTTSNVEYLVKALKDARLKAPTTEWSSQIVLN